jgi:putative ABC transport system permease protein
LKPRRAGRLYATFVVVGLALGTSLGVNGAVGEVCRHLGQPSPPGVPEPERVLVLPKVTNLASFRQASSEVNSLDLAGYVRRSVTVRLPAHYRTVVLECVTDDYFRVLGIRPRRGSLFGPGERAADAAVVSSDLYDAEFRTGTDTGLWVGQFNYRVVGVVPSDFVGVARERADVWILLAGSPRTCSDAGQDLLSVTGSWLTTVGRLKAGVSLQDAKRDEAALRVSDLRSRTPANAPAVETLSAQFKRAGNRDVIVARWLQVAAAGLLLISIVNAATLFGLRALSRRDEIAVRYQLGARRSHQITLLMREPLALVSLATAFAVFIGHIAYELISLLFPGGVIGRQTAWMFLWIGGPAVASLFLTGLGAAVMASRITSRIHVLQYSRARRLLERTAFVTQIAITAAVLIAASVFGRSLKNLTSDLGYDVERVAVVGIDVQRTFARDDREVQETRSALLNIARQFPNIEMLALAAHAPLDTDVPRSFTSIRLGNKKALVALNFVTGDYFRTLGIPMLEGASFAPGLGVSDPSVAIIDAPTREQLDPDGTLIGECVFLMGRNDCIRVAGVSGATTSYRLAARTPEVFLPLAHHSRYSTSYMGRTMVVRLAKDQPEAIRRLAGLSAYTGGLPVSVRTGMAVSLDHTRTLASASWILTCVSYLAGAMTVMGLGVSLSLLIGRRLRELGVRIALGASAWRLGLSLAGPEAGVLLAGVVLGAWLTSVSARSRFFGLDSIWTIDLVAGLSLFLVAGAGCLIAASVAALRVDPVLILKHDR